MPTTVSIVGMHFRPPAKLVLAGLPGGAHLRLEPEPSNPYDENAVKVLCDPNDMVPGYIDEIEDQLEGYGRTKEDLLAETSLHLGYVARTETHKCTGILGGILTFTGDGKPLCELDEPSKATDEKEGLFSLKEEEEIFYCADCGDTEVEYEGDACDDCLEESLKE